MKKIFNILGFQISWWICVLGAANNLEFLGPFIMLLFLIIHLFFFSQKSEIKLIIFFAFTGTLIDTLIVYTGALGFEGLYHNNKIIAPLWITAMWCGFSATINHSMAWLKNRWVAAILLGSILGPLAYITGEKFGAIYFYATDTKIFIILSIVWGMSIPFIYFVNSKLMDAEQ